VPPDEIFQGRIKRFTDSYEPVRSHISALSNQHFALFLVHSAAVCITRFNAIQQEMEEFNEPAAFEAEPGVDLDEDMDDDAQDLGDYEADGAEDLDDLDDDGVGVPFDPLALGLKEINNLARCRVSTFKPGNGVKELLDDDLSQYWQYVSPSPALT
jgi:hypothetical protein